jgi:hypothetical protein
VRFHCFYSVVASLAFLGCLLLVAISGCGVNASSPDRAIHVVTVQAGSGAITHALQILVR